MHNQRGRGALMLVLVLVQSACGPGWRTMRPAAPKALPPDRVARIWMADTARLWHRVAIEENSVSGIPVGQALDCDSCRQVLPRGEVDSIQTATAGTRTAGTAIVIGIGLVVGAFVVCVMQGGCNLRPYD